MREIKGRKWVHEQRRAEQARVNQAIIAQQVALHQAAVQRNMPQHAQQGPFQGQQQEQPWQVLNPEIPTTSRLEGTILRVRGTEVLLMIDHTGLALPERLRVFEADAGLAELLRTKVPVRHPNQGWLCWEVQRPNGDGLVEARWTQPIAHDIFAQVPAFWRVRRPVVAAATPAPTPVVEAPKTVVEAPEKGKKGKSN
jgi:hypothetical protein